jgi:hydroxymethylpyrimidine pyrophosphatase-like HAD family hydrolase
VTAAPLPVYESPGWRPKLVVLDLDGTVVPYAGFYDQPTPRVCAAIDAVRAAGVPVVIATGRAVWGALPTVRALGLAGVEIVASNGAVVYDGSTGVVRHEVTIDPGPAAYALAAGFSLAAGAAFAVERGSSGFLYTPDFAQDFAGSFIAPATVEQMVAERTPRMVCRPHDCTPPEAAAIATEALGGLPYSWDIGYSSWIDVMAPGISKASGVALLAADLGVSAADVLAIGDGGNDVDLFEWVGCAVAMGQSADPVLAAADLVTESVADDGVAVALERWF